MSPFRAKPDNELDGLDDDALLAYIRAARDVAERVHAVRALQILVFGHWDNVVRRVQLKVPAADAEDVAGEVIASAIRSAFDGESVGEFKVWLKTITSRRIADYHRSRAGDPQMSVLGASDDTPGSVEPIAPSSDGYVETQDVIERLLDELSGIHREVVELAIFGAVPTAAIVAGIENMTEANVHQILSRFRRELRRRLDEAPVARSV